MTIRLPHKASLSILVLSAFLMAPLPSYGLGRKNPAKILSHEKGKITFSLDQVEPAEGSISGCEGARSIVSLLQIDPYSDFTPEVLACSLDEAYNLHSLGEDALFQMLLRAWSQHRPVTLTPDAIWMVISQGLSHHINTQAEEFRHKLVSHEGKKELRVETTDLLAPDAPWDTLIEGFVAQIDKYTSLDSATSLVADFSTTLKDERMASLIVLMDVVKPFFDYTAFYAVCGIPSVTLTGTPEDWEKVLEKTSVLSEFGLGDWQEDLRPILEEFIEASRGNVDYWFWKDIVSRTRPRTIQGPSCTPGHAPITRVNGWFLKLFPYDDHGDGTPSSVAINAQMLSEAVAVPFKYEVVSPTGEVISTTPMELVSGIIAIEEDPVTRNLTPRIGWSVRTAKSGEQK